MSGVNNVLTLWHFENSLQIDLQEIIIVIILVLYIILNLIYYFYDIFDKCD